MTEKKEDNPLEQLLGKINHPLVEVRCRSLRSISFKLSNNLLSFSDLVHERGFLAHLLEWFNFDEWAMESQALSLIEQLARHEAAAKIFIEIGGVEFLSQLRLHCDTSLHPLIDEALDHMLKLPITTTTTNRTLLTASFDESDPPSNTPDDSTGAVHITTLSSNSQTTFSSSGSTTDFGSYPQISKESFGLHSTTMESPSLSHGLPQQYLHRVGTVPTIPLPPASDAHTQSYTPIASMNRQSMEGVNRQDELESTNLKFAYTPSALEPAEPYPIVDNGQSNETVIGSNGFFQWIRITKTDSHILCTTQSRIQNNCTLDSFLRSCEFIQDVLFQDFPAELFLQRPTLLNCLLKYLEHSENGGLSLFYPVLICLLRFTELLKHRVVQRMSPPMIHTDTYSTSVEECLLGSVPEADSLVTSIPHVHETHCDLEVLTPEILKHLQSQQLSVCQYCLSVISATSTLLLYCLHRDSLQLSTTGNHSEYNSMIVCVAKCLQLLTSVMELFLLVDETDDKESVNVLGSIESLCSVVSQCLSKWRRLSTQTKQPTPQLEMVCCITVCLTHSLTKLLHLYQRHDEKHLTDLGCLSGVLNGLMMNGVLCVTHPHLLNSLLPFFQVTDAANSRVFLKVKEVAISFEKMSTFLGSVSSSSTSNSESIMSMLTLACEAMQALWFASNEQFISQAMKLCFKVVSSVVSEDQQTERSTARTLLLKLLSHGSVAVKEKVYSHLQLLLNEHLPPMVHHSSTVNGTDSGSLLKGAPLSIIVDPDVVHLLCTSSAVSDSETVSTIMCHVLTQLLSLKTQHFWPQLRDLLLQWMPFLEVAMCHSEQLYKTMQSWLISTEQDLCLPELTKLQCFIRLLFSTSTQIRVWAYTQLSRMIISHNSLNEQQPFPFPTQSMISLHDVLIVGRSTRDHSVKRTGSFQHEDVTKLMHILRSPTLDMSLKKSAMEQLSLILQDRLLHEDALEEGIIDHLVVVLKTQSVVSQQMEQNESSLLIKHSIVCLLLLLHSSLEQRKKLSGDYELLMSLVKTAIQSHRDLESLYCLSKLLFLLLFTSAGIVIEEETIQSSNSLLKSLPFPVKGCNLDLNFETTCCMDPNLFTSDPLLSMLRLHYNVALAGSVSELISNHEKHQPPVDVEDGPLRLMKYDVLGLKCFSIDMRLRDCIEQLKEVTSHNHIVKLLQHTEVVFTACYTGQASSVTMTNLQWKEAIVRFLTIQPTTLKDTDLLDSLLKFISSTLLSSSSDRNDTSYNNQLMWLAETTCGHGAVCLHLLHSSMEQQQGSASHRSLQKTLMWFYADLMKTLVSQLDCNISEVCDFVTLLQILQQCLDIAGSPSYYDLPLLESTLECLVHLTASKANIMYTTASIGLLMKLLSSLRQVIWSFVSGQGVMVASFMGKGITSRAALSMCHLITIISSLQPPEEWWLKWFHSSHDTKKLWLYALVEDRDIKVRYAGFTILATLCSTLNVAMEILSDWLSSSPLGLWGTCMDVFRDDKECSLVKRQSLMVLVNLSALCNRQKKWNDLLVYTWNEVSIKGKDCLKHLLDFYEFLPTLLRFVNPKHQCKLTNSVLTNSSKHISTSPKGSFADQQENDNETLSQKDGVALTDDRDIDRRLFAFCDPHVVSVACCLLHNLYLASPELIETQVNWMETLIMVLDSSILQHIFAKKTRISSCWVKMCVDVLTLLNTVIVLQPGTILSHILNQKVVGDLCHHLSVVRLVSSKTNDKDCLEMCSKVLSLLQTLVTRVSFSKADLVFSSLLLHWNSFIGLLINSLLDETGSSVLKKHALTLFCSLLVHRFQAPAIKEGSRSNAEYEAMIEAMRYTLDVAPESHSAGKTKVNSEVGMDSPFGSVICGALLKAYDHSISISFSEEKKLVEETLGLLLAYSSSAKDTALESGLLESSLNSMKALHSRVCAENLERTTKKKQDSSTLSELVSTVNLVRNFMYKSSKIKSACVRCHLATVISDMWPACTVNKRLLLVVLKMLSVLSAQHTEGRASLAYANKGSVSLFQKVLKLTSQTISSYKNCAASKISNPHFEVLRVVFTLLSNCALSPECRATMKKTGFLSSFATLCPSSEKPSSKCPSTTRLSVLWIKLLVNLSFSSEGQQMFFKQPGSLEVLLDVYQYTTTNETQTSCLMVLRNLCFYGPGKTLMASNDNFLAILSNALDCENKQSAALAASAVWALLHNCVKMKNILRKSELSSKLQAVTSYLTPGKSRAKEKVDERYRQALIKAQELLIH